MDLSKIKFDEKGLVPAIVQDIQTKKVLMLAYMNEESLQKTIETKTTWFYSRSRKSLWNKGATSGNIQNVCRISYDCDGDTILLEVMQVGFACHTGKYSCFSNEILVLENYSEDIIEKVYNTIIERRNNPVEGSYTNYLFEKGIDKMLKKVGEESAEVIIASKNHEKSEITYEVSDLVYHVLVVLVNEGITIGEIKSELAKRHK